MFSGNPIPAPVTSWSDTQITVTVPSGVQNCAIQQEVKYQKPGWTSTQCGQLIITTATGKQSVDAVTVTIGGNSPTYVTTSNPLTQAGPGSIQTAIDQANPGDLIMVPPGNYNEILIMWKPIRLQGVGATSSIINANTQPSGKLQPWRAQVNCLFGFALNGVPVSSTNPSFDPTGASQCPGTGWMILRWANQSAGGLARE